MLQPFRLRRGQKALVIVAHPDDETIWMGGFILRYAALEWNIHALCRASDADRAPRFKRVCRLYGAKGSMSDLPDDGQTPAAEERAMIRSLIERRVRGRTYDLVFTHGVNGEYGHPQHRQVHRVVRALVREGRLPAARVLAFHYGKAGYRPGRPLRSLPGADLSVSLKPGEYRQKLSIMTEAYGFPAGGIDAGYSPSIESFKLIPGPHQQRGLNR